MQPPTIMEFKGNVSGHFGTVVKTGQPLPVRKHGRDYVTVLPSDLAERALAALVEKEATAAQAAPLTLLDELSGKAS